MSFAAPVAIILGLLVYGMSATQSCEERGLKTTLVYFMPIFQTVGGVQMTNMIPIYECR